MNSASRKKVAITLPRFSRYGGVEQFGYRLAIALAQKGYQVDFICARQEVESPYGVNVICTGRPFGLKVTKMLAFCSRTDKVIKAGNYACVIGLGKTKQQDILRVGGGPLREFWHYSEQAIPVGLHRCWKQLRRRLALDNRYTLNIEDTQYNGGSKQIIAVSHFVRDLILKSYPNLQSEDIKIIYNKPDLSHFYPPSPEERQNARLNLDIKPEIIAIGLATSNFLLKGTAPLIRSLQLLPENTSLYIAGGRGYQEYTKLAKKLGLQNRVHFLGKIKNMPEYYHALDIFTLPSFYDACSNAVLEALASGLPVLSSASNGSSYFLPPENIVQNPASPQELAKVLQLLLMQAAEHNKTGSRPNFTWPTDVESGLEAFIEQIEKFITKKEKQ